MEDLKPYAIICEYNPFHNGHKYQIDLAKAKGATHIVAIMSSCFVQRGDISILSKKARTLAALSCGVDLVLELPVIWSLASAERFARSAIYIAGNLSVIDGICFGCESTDVDDLYSIIDAESKISFQKELKNYLCKGFSYPRARALALKKYIPPSACVLLDKPNAILALEYIKAIKDFDFKLDIMPILRNVAHDSKDKCENICSSSLLREFILRCDNTFRKFIPLEVSKIIKDEIKNQAAPAAVKNIERAILLKLRELDKADFLSCPDVSEGLENRIYSCVRKAGNLAELFDSIKTKRYTHSRIRRILLSAVLGINKNIQDSLPKYARILGFDKRGEELVKLLKNSSKLPLIAKVKDIESLDDDAKRIFSLESKAEDMFSLAQPKVFPCGSAFKNRITKVTYWG